MKVQTNDWAKRGFGAALAIGILSACAQPSTEEAPLEAPSPPALADAGPEEMRHGDHQMETLPVEKRIAFMSGHVEAGLALYRAGAPDQAAKHLLHPVSETHEAERAGIDALGFEQDLFLDVSAALDAGRPAEEIEPQLAAAEANMALMQSNAGGDPVEIIAYLMDTVVEEYQIGVSNGVITDPGEYQDAFGFTVVAIDTAARIETADTAQLIDALDALLALWPDTGPLAASTPAPLDDLVAQVSRVSEALEAL